MTEKTLAWILIAAVIAVVLVIFFKPSSEVDRLKQESDTYKSRAERAERERDNAKRNLKLTRDSLDIAFHTLRLSKMETEKSIQKANEADRKLREIVKIITKTDHERDSILRALYPELY